MTVPFLPPLSIRGKLTLAAVVPLAFILLLVSLATFNLINAWIVGQAQSRVRNDLNTARTVLAHENTRIANIVRLTGSSGDLAEQLAANDLAGLDDMLAAVRTREGFDLLTLTDRNGNTLIPRSGAGTARPLPFVSQVLAGEHYSGSILLNQQQLRAEGNDLARRAVILAPTNDKEPSQVLEERGMILIGASPVFDRNDQIVGCLYGGTLLNSNVSLVDQIKETVYGAQSIEDVRGGSATIFLKDLRATTTIRLQNGVRAVGTRVSPEVARAVLEQKQTWLDRAKVVDQWYLTAYEPILDSSGAAIGALYVGLLEQPFSELKARSAMILLGLLLLGCGFGYLVARYMSKVLCRPILELDAMARQVAAGERDIEIVATTRDEIGHLTNTFNQMATALQERENELNRLNRELEGKVVDRTHQLEEKSFALIAAQQELLRNEKLAAIGSLAAGVAHEINNPTAIIRGNIEILQMELAAGASGREEADEILKQTERISLITRNMLTFAREQSFQFDTVDLNTLITDILAQISHQVELGTVELVVDLDPAIPDISSDGQRLRQVLTNIMVNGLQAMEGAGRLTISSRFDEKQVTLTVTDSGPGMDDATREKIFNPFFTTKHEGTGLGLSVSYGIVQALGGRITVESAPGTGATFTVRIPRQTPTSSAK